MNKEITKNKKKLTEIKLNSVDTVICPYCTYRQDLPFDCLKQFVNVRLSKQVWTCKGCELDIVVRINFSFNCSKNFYDNIA